MKQLIATVLFFYALTSSAIDFKYDTHICGENETLDSIAKKYIKSHELAYRGDLERFKQDLKKWNKQLEHWYPIPEFTKIYTAYPYPAHVAESSYSPSLNHEEAIGPQGPQSHISLFYLFSIGNFSEKVSSTNTKIETTQNSPYSLGIGFGHTFTNPNHSLLSSFYYSKLVSSKIADTHFSEGATQIELPSEIGANLYYQYLLSSNNQVLIYSGLDFERFSTYNSKEVALGTEELKGRQNTLYYASLGFAKNIYFSDLKLQIKTSVAQSIHTKSSGPLESDQFKGQRFLFFSSLRLTPRISGQILYKFHNLEGPTKLQITRIGLGVAISLL